MKRRRLTLDQASRALLMQGAFTTASLVRRATREQARKAVRKLRRSLKARSDARVPVIDRILRGLAA